MSLLPRHELSLNAVRSYYTAHKLLEAAHNATGCSPPDADDDDDGSIQRFYAAQRKVKEAARIQTQAAAAVRRLGKRFNIISSGCVIFCVAGRVASQLLKACHTCRQVLQTPRSNPLPVALQLAVCKHLVTTDLNFGNDHKIWHSNIGPEFW